MDVLKVNNTQVNDYLQRTQMPEFFNLWCVIAVMLFALNNHYLKYEYHNWFTGKLSDFAACFFLPLFLSALLALISNWRIHTRLFVGVIVTALIFSAVKISVFASTVLNATLSFFSMSLGMGESSNIADSSDLAALPMLAVAYLYGINKVTK